MYEQDPAEIEHLSDGAGMSSEDTGSVSQHNKSDPYAEITDHAVPLFPASVHSG